MIIADTHLHFYPCYDSSRAILCLFNNLHRIGGNAVKVAFLAERHDCHFFGSIRSNPTSLSASGVEVSTSINEDCAAIHRNGQLLYLIAGRQIVSEEGLEVLALGTDEAIPANKPVLETIEQVISVGGLPVLSWAPGKWFFDRGRIVRELIESYEPGKFLIGDTSLRPTVWGEPFLMRLARKKGFGVISGSDPLPIAGEERYMGTYGSLLDILFDAGKPLESIRSGLTVSHPPTKPVGRRCGPFAAFSRLLRHVTGR